jgi:ketosteroid isomerase-like protein
MDQHPNAKLVVDSLAAVAAGDLDGFVPLLREDFHNVNDIGAGPWRESNGRDEFLAFFGAFSAVLEGTFRQEIMDVIGYDDNVVLVVHETGEAQGQTFDNRAIYLVGVEDGMLTSLRTMDMDHDNIRRFWANVTVPATT